jgi:hypothetical protein
MQSVGKIQRFLMLKEVVHIVTAVFLGIKECVKYKSIPSKIPPLDLILSNLSPCTSFTRPGS